METTKVYLVFFRVAEAGYPEDRGGHMRQGAHLPGKVTKHKKLVREEMADSTKKIEDKAIMEEGEEKQQQQYDSSQIQYNNFLKGNISSSFVDEAVSAESNEEENAEPSKVPEKKLALDEEIMKSSSSAQKKAIKRLFQTNSFGKSYDSNARSKPLIFVPKKGDPIAYQSMSAMTRVNGLSKAILIGKSNFKAILLWGRGEK